ncbi:Rossmann-fold NAD(P)-binding domain-containing protein [Bacillus mojavensis]|uniref:hypothetical protein n=1 Tax=Bacillus mojavensis TaxID=72360 RepID=UPI002DB7DA3E|nr:hypothetical protein [Bacillus mojavensis]MEC1290289.1 hypothetical protein [Bacillus mojavensis]MEC1620766.1 hypothetical protein [Bacillus mojavensis]MEC1636197.1 hypothetical protein [Bacillus mojavensis]MEC1659668.1 hypothetical protein [Bacillus mojavensis]MEC1682139.1 hypothetical protein [Bacillus mojavensis]
MLTIGCTVFQDSRGIEALFDDLFQHIRLDTKPEGIYVINNAGVLAPIGPIEQHKTEDMIENLQVNLIAPMAILCSTRSTSKRISES